MTKDLSDKVLYVGNQGWIGACTGFAVTQAYEMLMYPKRIDLSPWYLYHKTFITDSIDDEKQSGARMIECLATLREYGCCETEFWDLNMSDRKFRGIAKDGADNNAKNYKITFFGRVKKDNKSLKRQLNNDNPIIVGVDMFEGLIKAGANKGIVNENIGKDYGNHAMVIVGYDDEKQHFKLLNSWGEKWGDKGYCYMTYDYMSKVLKESYIILKETIPSKPKEEKKGFFAFIIARIKAIFSMFKK